MACCPIPPGPGGFAPGGGGGGGGGSGGWGGGFGIHINPDVFHGYADDRISCREGKGILRDFGFRRVRALECGGRIFTYKAKRGNRNYRVKMRSRDGEIVSRHRL